VREGGREGGRESAVSQHVVPLTLHDEQDKCVRNKHSQQKINLAPSGSDVVRSMLCPLRGRAVGDGVHVE
jgi:hypothetical protein